MYLIFLLSVARCYTFHFCENTYGGYCSDYYSSDYFNFSFINEYFSNFPNLRFLEINNDAYENLTIDFDGINSNLQIAFPYYWDYITLTINTSISYYTNSTALPPIDAYRYRVFIHNRNLTDSHNTVFSRGIQALGLYSDDERPVKIIKDENAKVNSEFYFYDDIREIFGNEI